jgi:hypothetical protein
LTYIKSNAFVSAAFGPSTVPLSISNSRRK